MTELSTATPRFVFIHRFGVSLIPPDDVPAFMQQITTQFSNKDRGFPLMEYFVPDRKPEAPSYQLTVVDLSNLTKVDA